jgi:hypothetical protein
MAGRLSTSDWTDNVLESGFVGIACTRDADDCHDQKFYNNLILPCTACLRSAPVLGASLYMNYTGTQPQQLRRMHFWNNIILTNSPTIASTGFAWGSTFVSGDASNATIAYSDYNLYQSVSNIPAVNFPVQYQVGPLATYCLTGCPLNQWTSTFQMDANSVVDAVPNIFSDLGQYIVKAPYDTGGRFGDTYGPRIPVGSAASDGIMHVARYGPSALPASTRGIDPSSLPKVRGRLVGGTRTP